MEGLIILIMIVASTFYIGKVVVDQIIGSNKGCGKCGCDDNKGYGRKKR